MEKKMQLEAEKILQIHVNCGPAKAVKNNGCGYLQIIPILSGTVEGVFEGTVLSGGADWNLGKPDGISHVCAKYMLETGDGEVIGIQNEGKIKWDDGRKIKTFTTFEANVDGKYDFLNHGVYVGALGFGKEDGQIEITIFRLK